MKIYEYRKIVELLKSPDVESRHLGLDLLKTDKVIEKYLNDYHYDGIGIHRPIKDDFSNYLYHFWAYKSGTKDEIIKFKGDQYHIQFLELILNSIDD